MLSNQRHIDYAKLRPKCPLFIANFAPKLRLFAHRCDYLEIRWIVTALGYEVDCRLDISERLFGVAIVVDIVK